MKELYSEFTKDELWLIKAPSWSRKLQNVRETQFTLGNGYLGTRGVLEEIPYDAMPGTYIAGVYDKMTSQVDELVNLPNPLNFKFTVAGEKLDLVAMDSLEHQRILNMRKALLIRHSVYKDTKAKKYDYQSLRFISLDNKNIGVIQIALTALDAACSIDVSTGIDTSVSNSGILSEGKKRHFRIRELGQAHNAGYLAVETLEKKHIVICWGGFYYQLNGRKLYAKDNVFRLKLKKGQSVIFTKMFYIKRFPYQEDIASYKKASLQVFQKAFRSKFSKLIASHMKKWQWLWNRADIVVAGTENLQKNLRFNIYHMLICAHYDNGFSSIGARTLSGEGYRGHIFWDAEIFLLPFYLFTFPQIAKNMLLYRFNRLDKSRELAQGDGFKGVKFAWESAATGDEETPEWSRDFDRTVIKIFTHQQEHHITADVAYAIYKYYLTTADQEFMRKYGYEMLFETARFWASRVKYNRRKKRYVINQIIGPDEFHLQVNNNAFTNIMAKWNLRTAYKLFYQLKKESALYAKLKSKLNLTEKEVRTWKKIAAGIGININKKKIIEEFDGYFKLKKVIPTRTNENGIPLIPRNLKLRDFAKTQLVKQADVVMLLYLLGDVFSLQAKIANYNFYIPRTMHKSSLSPSIHSILACEVGDSVRAYNFFKVALHTDISNTYNNTHEGIHAASLGGTWQAVIFGFAGVKIRGGKMSINPRLPGKWGKLIFSLAWKGDLIKFTVTNDIIELKVSSRQGKKIELTIFNKTMQLSSNKSHLFTKHRMQAEGGGFY